MLLDKIAGAYLFEKYIYILALETASPIVSALSFPGRSHSRSRPLAEPAKNFRAIKCFGGKLEPNTGRFEWFKTHRLTSTSPFNTNEFQSCSKVETTGPIYRISYDNLTFWERSFNGPIHHGGYRSLGEQNNQKGTEITELFEPRLLSTKWKRYPHNHARIQGGAHRARAPPFRWKEYF